MPDHQDRAADPAAPARTPRLLWASVYCLLDTSSGAAMAVREMLRQLARHGYDIAILGAAVFDHARGAGHLDLNTPRGRVATVRDGSLIHRLYVTERPERARMTAREETAWFALYRHCLDRHRPDLVCYYGGQALDYLIAAEARARGLPVAFYLANANYGQLRWCRDVDLVLTNSQAMADLYRQRLGIRPVPLGLFVDPRRVVAPQHVPERILFVNPLPEKGAGLVARLARLLQQRRPEFRFEVVESRGAWEQALRAFPAAPGEPEGTLDNVTVTPTTADMRPVYGRARLLLAPSLCWEAAGRVVAESLLNGIPAIVTARGGMPEMLGEGGLVCNLPAAYHAPPYRRVPSAAELEPLLRQIARLHDDPAYYAQLAARARRAGERRHGLAASTGRLLAALQPLLARRAGDRDPGALLRQRHRHGLDDRPPSADGPAPLADTSAPSADAPASPDRR